MNPRLYNRLLLRLLGLPVAALSLLVLVLVFGLAQLEQNARRADHSDQILASANQLLGLIVDEETGVRGYLLVHDPVFLQPMQEAAEKVDRDFDKLKTMVARRPDQVALLTRLQADHRQWRQVAMQEIQFPPTADQMPAALLQRKAAMDNMRGQMTDFMNREEIIRDQRIAIVSENTQQSRVFLIGVVALIALLLTWEIRRIFIQLTLAHNEQVAEIRLRSDESYAREQWLRITLESIGDAVIACDSEGHVVFMNPIAQQLTGWTENEASGISLHEVFPIFNEDTRNPVENPVDKVRRLGTVVGLANHTFLVSRDGREISIDDSGAPIRDSLGKMIGIVLVFRDISDRRVSEAAMMRAEKLAAAGRLAATVAHEVNNPLEGLTNLVFIARRSDDMEEIRHLLAQAETELSRIAHITRQSLGFYRETTMPLHFKPADVVREVTEFYALRARALGVSFVVTGSTERHILGAPGELRQVLSNLIANSLDACQAGASIRVHIASAIDPRNPLDKGVRISVIDTGQGIHPNHLRSIFDPFFTTKKETGTGLGLWVSRELIEKHGGTLRVRSTTMERSGSVFSIFLPERGGPQVIAPVSGATIS